MASTPSYDVAAAFLESDVLTTVNNEQSALLEAGSVSVTRAPRAKSGTRRANAPPFCVEVVPRGESPAKAVGIGVEEVGHSFDLECNVRRKSPEGRSQLDVAEDMCRALVRRYRGVSALAGLSDVIGLRGYFASYFVRPYFAFPYFGPSVFGARFVRSDAQRVEIDVDPESSERVRAVTRVTFTFLEKRASNA